MSGERITVTIDSDLEDLIPGFLENRRKDVNLLNEALAAGKIDTLKSIGHSLKGVGGGYGFQELSTIGAEIEKIAKAVGTAGVRELIDSMADYLDKVDVTFE
jgi:HPt (histidine-containing phosphotransfer) domain-containing protein